MAKRSLSDQLEQAVAAVLARRGAAAAPADARLASLVEMAEQLRDLPRPDFKARLRIDLEGRKPMASTPRTAQAKRTVSPVPEGYLTVAPHLTIKGAAAAIEFYKKALGATEVMRLPMPDGTVGHAEIRIGDSVIMLSDEFPKYGNLSPETLGGSTVRIHLYVEDVDAVAARAAAEGAILTSPPADRDYGERSAVMTDPFGHHWAISTHLEDMTFEQYRERHAPAGGAGKPPRPGVKPASPVRPGFHDANVQLTVSNGREAIEFYKRAFGAVEREAMRFAAPGGELSHAELTIGDSGIMLQGESEEYHRQGPVTLGGTPVIIHLYVEDVDALASQAVAAGARVLIPVADQFYGDRSGRLQDPFGHVWIISTHIEDVPPEELERRTAAFTQGASAPPAVAAPRPAIREGFSSVTPYLAVRRAVELLDFLSGVFGATVLERVPGPSGGLMHAEVRIGNSMVMLGGSPDMAYPETPGALHTYVGDVDAVYQRSLAAGAASIQAPQDMNYGERGASVKDAFGNFWYLAAPLAGRPVPEGLRSVTPYLHPHDAGRVIEFLQRAFGAEEVSRYTDAAGVIHHAAVRIGDAMIEMGEAHGPYQPMPSAVLLYVDDVDAVHTRAVAAGASVVRPPADQPYGERLSWVTDPFGFHWYIAKPLARAT